MNIKNLFNSKKNAKSTDESSAPVNWLGFTGKPGTIGSHTIGYPVTKETLEKINSYADAIGYPVTRESLKNTLAFKMPYFDMDYLEKHVRPEFDEISEIIPISPEDYQKSIKYEDVCTSARN